MVKSTPVEQKKVQNLSFGPFLMGSYRRRSRRRPRDGNWCGAAADADPGAEAKRNPGRAEHTCEPVHSPAAEGGRPLNIIIQDGHQPAFGFFNRHALAGRIVFYLILFDIAQAKIAGLFLSKIPTTNSSSGIHGTALR